MPPLVEIPGAVNAHTHLYSGLAPLGMPRPSPPPATFLEILRRVWWRLDRALDASILRAAARYHAAHALLAGTTALLDHHESPAFIEGSLDVLAGACDDLGVRAALCYGATERNGGPAEARRGLAEARRFIESRRRLSADNRVCGLLGLHASFTVSDATLRETADLARALGVPVHVHVAEDGADVADARARGHAGPLERLLAAGALPPGSILAHGVHLDAPQVRQCEARGLWLVHNPRSNAANRVGYAMSLGASARVALGTDGFPSDMRDERDALAREASAHGDGAADPGARVAAGRALAAQLFGPAAIEGDRARVEPGGARPRVVEVDVGGEPVVRDGALVRASLASIEADARRAAAALWDRMERLSGEP